MAFSFGNTAQPGFGAAQNKPTGFGTPFGATTTTASSGFGSFGSSFGAAPQQPAFGSTAQQPSFGSTAQQQPTFGSTAQQQQQQPSFGSSFGQPATGAPAPAFGSTFGAQASAAPAFGSTFGAAAAPTSAPNFGTFGSTPTAGGTGLFGSAAATTKPSLFGSQLTATTPSLFSTPANTGTNLFGGTTTSQAPSLFGGTPNLFGAQTTSAAPSLFGSSFGTAPTSSAPSLFGGGGSTSAAPAFGNLFGGTTTSAPSLFGGFGTNTTTTGSGGFGGSGGFTGFGATPSSFGAFGTGATGTTNLFGTGGFGQKPAQTVLAATVDPNQQVLSSFYAINIFGDERDDILKKWNMLQACWGTGKGFFNAIVAPVEYNLKNPFYRFKAVGYNIIPELDNSEGYVTLTFTRKESELKNQKEVLVNGIGGIIGNRPNLTVNIVSIKGVAENQTEVRITVLEKGVTGNCKKIPASDLCAFLSQPTQKQQLTNVGVICILPYVSPTKTALEEYKKNPPPGIDLHMWQAANLDNPNPQKYIPASINGFEDLKNRMLAQQNETNLHTAFIDKVSTDITELKKKHLASQAQINELKQKFLQLQHRILRILVKQESSRKVGLTISPEEEMLRGRLEILHSHLKVPTQFKGQINELLSSVKMMGSMNKQVQERYYIDPDAQEDIKQFLKMEQNGIAHLVNIINSDLQTLKTVSEGMNQMLQSRTNM